MKAEVGENARILLVTLQVVPPPPYLALGIIATQREAQASFFLRLRNASNNLAGGTRRKDELSHTV